MAAARRAAAPSPEALEEAMDLVRQVKRAGSLEALAEALDIVGRADHEVYRIATAKIDFTKLPRFGGAPVEDEGALSWDEQMVLLVGDSLTDLTIKPRPGVQAPEPLEEDDPLTSAEAVTRQREALGEEPTLEAFEAAVRASADELGVAVQAVSIHPLPLEVVIQITILRDGAGVTSQTRRDRARWRESWRQIAAQLAQQIADEEKGG